VCVIKPKADRLVQSNFAQLHSRNNRTAATRTPTSTHNKYKDRRTPRATITGDKSGLDVSGRARVPTDHWHMVFANPGRVSAQFQAVIRFIAVFVGPARSKYNID
jgi:hypothetical protein